MESFGFGALTYCGNIKGLLADGSRFNYFSNKGSFLSEKFPFNSNLAYFYVFYDFIFYDFFYYNTIGYPYFGLLDAK